MSGWYRSIPAHWYSARVKSVAERVTDGAHISPDTENGLYDFVSTRDVKAGTINFAGSLKTTQETYDYMVKTGCRPSKGDILFSKDGTVGETAVITDDHEFVVASSLVIITPQLSVMTPSYLAHMFASRPAQEQAVSFMRGAGLPRLSVGNLGRLEVLVPPLDEQRAIADYLDRETARIDTLIEEQQRLIEMLRERRHALIERSMRDSSDAPIRLSRIASSRSGDVPPPLEEDGQYVVWGAGRVVGHTSQVNAQAGDLLVGRVGQGSVGKVRRLTENAWATDNTIVLRLDLSAAEPRYIEYGLRLIPRFDLVGGGAMPLVTAERLLAQMVPFATLGTQQRITDHLDEQTAKIDLLITETVRFIELSKERRAALITAAVTGQMDVRVMT